MASVGPAPAGASAAGTYIEWSPVVAGAVLAAAISFVLLTFGAAIGLSVTSPWPGSGVSAKVAATLAVFWALVQQIGAFMVGGYIAGRMRSRWAETGDEADFRDGLHGGLVWAVGVAIGAVILLSTAGAAARTGAETIGRAGIAAAASSSDPMDGVIDTMLRSGTVAQATTTPPAAGQASPPPAPAAQSRRAVEQMAPAEQRAEIARLLAKSTASASVPAEDRAHLAQLVAQRTGLSPQEAERRVNEAVTSAKAAADKARKAAVLTGFVTAAGLLISFAAAWWAALKGGNHRDHAVPARFSFDTRRRSTIPS